LRALLVVLVLATAPLAAAYDAEAERAVRLKTTRQLKEILKALKISFKASATKEELRELALKKDAIAKYEQKFPEKAKKRKPKAKRAGPDAGELLRMLDIDGDGTLSREEVIESGAFRPQGMDPDMEGMEEMEQRSFEAMDMDGDDFVSKRELAAFLRMIEEQQAQMAAGGGGYPYGYDDMVDPAGGMPPQDNVVGDDAIDYALDDDDELLLDQHEL